MIRAPKRSRAARELPRPASFFGHEYKRDVSDIAVSTRCKKRQLCVRNKSEVTGYYKCENAESGLLAEAAEHQAPCKRNRGLEV